MAYNFEIFDVLIVDSDLESRSKLKQAAREISCYGQITTVNYLSEALEHLNAKRKCDLVFVSNTFDQNDILEFLKKARDSDLGSICSYVLVMKSGKKESTDIAKSMIAGFNGMLLEPYSVDAMVDISKMARKVKVEALNKRIRAASELVVPTLIKEIDRLAALKKLGNQTTVSIGARKAIELVSSLGKDILEGYFETLCDRFEALPPPASYDYSGPSKRLKKQLEKKKLEEVAEQLSSEIANDAKNFG